MDQINRDRAEFNNYLDTILQDMNSQNTVIIGTLGESPYAEFMGDINNEYCKGTTKFVEGCLYNMHINEYSPEQQKLDLILAFDPFAYQVIGKIRSRD